MSKTQNKDMIYRLNLKDKYSIVIDDSGKSIACFAVKENVVIDRKIIEELKMLSQKFGRKDIRICLHNDRDSNLHDMINLIYERRKYPT